MSHEGLGASAVLCTFPLSLPSQDPEDPLLDGEGLSGFRTDHLLMEVPSVLEYGHQQSWSSTKQRWGR